MSDATFQQFDYFASHPDVILLYSNIYKLQRAKLEEALRIRGLSLWGDDTVLRIRLLRYEVEFYNPEICIPHYEDHQVSQREVSFWLARLDTLYDVLWALSAETANLPAQSRSEQTTTSETTRAMRYSDTIPAGFDGPYAYGSARNSTAITTMSQNLPNPATRTYQTSQTVPTANSTINNPLYHRAQVPIVSSHQSNPIVVNTQPIVSQANNSCNSTTAPPTSNISNAYGSHNNNAGLANPGVTVAMKKLREEFALRLRDLVSNHENPVVGTSQTVVSQVNTSASYTNPTNNVAKPSVPFDKNVTTNNNGFCDSNPQSYSSSASGISDPKVPAVASLASASVNYTTPIACTLNCCRTYNNNAVPNINQALTKSANAMSQVLNTAPSVTQSVYNKPVNSHQELQSKMQNLSLNQPPNIFSIPRPVMPPMILSGNNTTPTSSISNSYGSYHKNFMTSTNSSLSKPCTTVSQALHTVPSIDNFLL